VVRVEDRPIATPWADAWYRWVSAAFLRSYLETTAGTAFVSAREDLPMMLNAQVLEKAFHELRDELDRCAETTAIPMASIIEIAGL